MIFFLLIALSCAAVALIILALIPPQVLARFIRKEAPLTGLSLKDDFRPDMPGPSDSALQKEAPPQKKEAETEKLTIKLKEAKEELKRLQEELALEKSNEAGALQELSKLKIGIEKDKGAQENYKKGFDELKDKLVKKDEEYEKELSLNLNLNKAVSEYKQRCESLEREKSDYSEKLRILEAHNKAYKEELKKQAELLRQLNKQNEDNQWVSRKEYDALKEQLSKENNGKELRDKS